MDASSDIRKITPRWLDNYAPGYIGFSFNTRAPLSYGISYFQRWVRMSDIRVSHTFVVSGEDSCIEAVAGGVREGPLGYYFNDPYIRVFFREPRDYTADMGRRISSTAASLKGKRYDTRLIAGHLAANLWLLRRALAKDHHPKVERWLLARANDPDAYVCSEVAAFALDCQWELCDVGCLKDPHELITPQRLFEDAEVFKEWKHRA